MSGFLLDTNVVSEMRKPRPRGALLAWIKDVPAEDLSLPAIVIGELQAGVQITRAQDSAKAFQLEEWIDRIVSTYQVIPMDAPCFREWARLMRGRANTVREDAMVAATARVHGLTIATRNERDFSAFPVPLFNPFSVRS